MAEDTLPASANLRFAAKTGDVARYNIKVEVVGKTKSPGANQAVPVDPVLNLGVGVTTGPSANDGSFPLFVTCDKASATLAGTSVGMDPSMFPKLTAMLDKAGAVTRILPPDPARSRQPGINYRSFVLLLNANAPEGDIKPGTTWKKTIAVPSEIYKYDVTYKLEGVEKLGSVAVARVRADISLVPPAGSASSGKGYALNLYSLDGAKLLKSHSEMNVKIAAEAVKTPSGAPAADDPGDFDALIKVDITQAGK